MLPIVPGYLSFISGVNVGQLRDEETPPGLARRVAITSLVFVLGLEMAVAGVAWATVIAEYAGMVVGLGLAARLAARHGGRWQAARILDTRQILRFLAINRDIFLRTLFVITAFAIFTTVMLIAAPLLIITAKTNE